MFTLTGLKPYLWALLFAFVTALGIGVYSFVASYRAISKANVELTTEVTTLTQTVNDLRARTSIDNKVTAENAQEQAKTQETNAILRKETFDEYFKSELDPTPPLVQFPVSKTDCNCPEAQDVVSYTMPDVALRNLIDRLQLATCAARSETGVPPCTSGTESKVQSK